MSDILNGGGAYSRDRVLGIELDPTRINVDEVLVPRIEEIRLIRGADNEDYVNVNDLYIMMKILAYKIFPSLSVLLFIKAVIHEFLPTRR